MVAGGSWQAVSNCCLQLQWLLCQRDTRLVLDCHHREFQIPLMTNLWWIYEVKRCLCFHWYQLIWCSVLLVVFVENLSIVQGKGLLCCSRVLLLTSFNSSSENQCNHCLTQNEPTLVLVCVTKFAAKETLNNPQFCVWVGVGWNSQGMQFTL